MPIIYLDSCLVIYLVEKHPDYYTTVVHNIQQNAQAYFVVSSLTALLTRYQMFLDQFQVNGIDDQVMLKAIDYRVSGLKTPDAIHLACALHLGCDQFWTNDNRLAKVSSALDIQCLLTK
jgi:predicted nucleic acid-binding protein